MIWWNIILIFQYLSFLLVVLKLNDYWNELIIFDSLTQQCIACADDCPIVWHDSPANANEQQIDHVLRLWLTSHFEHHCSQFTLSGTQPAEYSTVPLLQMIQLATPCQVQAKSSLKSLGFYLLIWKSTQIKTQTSSNLALKLQGDTLWVLLWRRIATASCSDWELRLNED